MATYKLKIPVLEAIQFTGTNLKEIKDFVGDTSPGEDLMISKGTYTQPPPQERALDEFDNPILDSEGNPKVAAPPPGEPPFIPEEEFEKWDINEGDWVTKDSKTGKIEINPEGFPAKYEFVV